MPPNPPASPVNPMQLGLSLLLLTAAIALGGGPGWLGDTAVQLLAVVLLAFMLLQATVIENGGRPRIAASAWIPVVAVLLLPITHLLPLPEGLWLQLGQRADIAGELAAAGVEPQPRLGLNPDGAERALFWLLPGIALYLSMLRMPRSGQQVMLAALLVMVAVGVLLGLAQLAGGHDSPLRFHSNTNLSEAVGFFANRNHYASLLAMCLPLALAATASAFLRRNDDRAAAALRVAIAVALCLLLILGLAMARSRAGLLLGMLALLSMLPVILLAGRQRGMRRLLAVTLLAAAVLVVQFALFGILQRLQHDPLDDDRWAYLDIARTAAAEYAPTGSGLGTFQQAFEPFERDSKIGAGRAYVNHAHNDYIELWMETGWLLVPALAAFLAWLAWRMWRSLRGRPDADRKARLRLLQQRGIAAALLLPLLHSIGDYPLRTTSMIAAFGLLLGIFAAHGRARPASRAAETLAAESSR